MLWFCFVETILLFAGLLICFLLTARADGGVLNSLNKIWFNILSLEVPPVPSVDVFMWVRLLLLLVLAIAMTNDLDFTFRTLMDWWDNVFLFIWDTITDLGQVVIYFVDLVLPLYNWFITLVYQSTRGTYLILAKCQVRSIVEGMIHLGEAMVSLGLSLTRFVMNPKGAFDIYDTAISLQQAVLSQESVLECACDGISPVFAIALDVVRSHHLGEIVNETFNVFIGVPQTILLAVPPFSEIPDGARLLDLQRLALAAGFRGVGSRAESCVFGCLVDLDAVDGEEGTVTTERLALFLYLDAWHGRRMPVGDMVIHTAVFVDGQPSCTTPSLFTIRSRMRLILSRTCCFCL